MFTSAFHHQQQQQQQQQQHQHQQHQQHQESHVMPSLLFSPPGSSGARSVRHAAAASGGTSGGGRARKTKLFLDFQDVGNGTEAEKNASPSPKQSGFNTVPRSGNMPFLQQQDHNQRQQHTGTTVADASPSPSPPTGHTLRADIDKEQDWTPPMATWGDEFIESADVVMDRGGGGAEGGDRAQDVAEKRHEDMGANGIRSNDNGWAGGGSGDGMPQSTHAFESRDAEADVWSTHRPQPSNSWTSALARIVFGSGI